MLWPVVWWAFDVATLWACFEAFGDAPATGTIILCYFLGAMGNLLPIPGGVGGTEGGMVGAFAASGVDAGSRSSRSSRTSSSRRISRRSRVCSATSTCAGA